MKPALEPPYSGLETASLAAFERNRSSFPWNWHYHPEIELTWIRGGHGTRLVGDHSGVYEPGDLVLLGSNLPHTWVSAEASQRNRAIVVQFHPQLFPEAMLGLPQFAAIAGLLHEARRGIRFPAQTAWRAGAGLRGILRLEGLSRWLTLARLLDELASTRGEREILASTRYQHRRSCKLNTRLERVVEHLEKQWREEIPLAEAAAVAGLTPSAFSRFFRKMTRQTFTGYRNACRIRNACRLLDETDLSITDVAFQCGFGNLSNFNRRFREFKRLAPREYRRQHDQPV